MNSKRAKTNPKRPATKMIQSGLRVIATSYASLLLLLVLIEPWILFPAPELDRGDWSPESFGATECFVPSEDGTQVHVWMLAHENPRATILFAHGNAQHLGTMGEALKEMSRNWKSNVIAFDYRGYGKTGGSPSQKGIHDDAVAVARWVEQQSTWNDVPIVCVGRSLGGYAAIVAANEIDADGLLLDRTFSSAVDVAASKYPIFPVRLLMRNRFPSKDLIATYQGPILQIHGVSDEVIPVRSGEQLHSAATSKEKELLKLQNLGHNHPLPRSFWSKSNQWLDKVSSRGESE